MIRQAVERDLDAVLGIEQSSPTAAHWTEAQYTAAIRGPERLFLVTEQNGLVVALLVAFTGAPEWELENIAVLPSARRHGVGQALMQVLIAAAEQAGATEIRQEIRASNMPAQRLGQKLGFVQEGRRPGYYRHPNEDALLFKYLVANASESEKKALRQLRKEC